MIYISGPGHGGNAMVAHTYLEGSYSEVYPFISEDEEGEEDSVYFGFKFWNPWGREYPFASIEWLEKLTKTYSFS